MSLTSRYDEVPRDTASADREIPRPASTARVTRPQLLTCGVSLFATRHRASRADFGRAHPACTAASTPSATGRPHPTPGRWRPSWPAARDAVLSHRSAAALWGLGRWARAVEVTAPKRAPARGRPRPSLTDAQACRRHSPLRHPGHRARPHAHGLARVLDPPSLTRAVNEARLRHLIAPRRRRDAAPRARSSRTPSWRSSTATACRGRRSTSSWPATRSTCWALATSDRRARRPRLSRGRVRGGPGSRRHG